MRRRNAVKVITSGKDNRVVTCGHIETIERLNKRKEITEDDYSIRVFKDKN